MIAIASPRKPKILAVSSGGGHWVELMRIRSALAGGDLAFVTVNEDYRDDVIGHRFYAVQDATRWNKLGVAVLATQVLRIVLRERPDVIITTGAAPGYFALRFGKLLWSRTRTIWLDSIANVDELSMSGRMAGRYADLWLTQWPHLAEAENESPVVRREQRRELVRRDDGRLSLLGAIGRAAPSTRPQYAGAVL